MKSTVLRLLLIVGIITIVKYSTHLGSTSWEVCLPDSIPNSHVPDTAHYNTCTGRLHPQAEH